MSMVDLMLVLGAVLTWGFSFVVIKIGLASLPPLLFSGLRFVFAALPLVLFVRRPAIPWRYLVGYGLIQFALQFALLFGGMRLGMAAGLSALVIQLQAFFTIVLAALVLHERITAAQIGGGALGIAGLVLVASYVDSRATLIGFVMVLGASVAWACANLLTKRIGTVNPLALVGWGSVVAAPPLLLLSCLVEGRDTIVTTLSHLDWRAWSAILFMAYPNTILCFGIWAVMMRRYPTATVAPFSLLIPISAMFSGVLVLGETLTWWKIAAALLIVAGIALSQWDVWRRSRRVPNR
jgi:O-acetylserine/cysteine efflux transporter